MHIKVAGKDEDSRKVRSERMLTVDAGETDVVAANYVVEAFGAGPETGVGPETDVGPTTNVGPETDVGPATDVAWMYESEMSAVLKTYLD